MEFIHLIKNPYLIYHKSSYEIHICADLILKRRGFQYLGGLKIKDSTHSKNWDFGMSLRLRWNFRYQLLYLGLICSASCNDMERKMYINHMKRPQQKQTHRPNRYHISLCALFIHSGAHANATLEISNTMYSFQQITCHFIDESQFCQDSSYEPGKSVVISSLRFIYGMWWIVTNRNELIKIETFESDTICLSS